MNINNIKTRFPIFKHHPKLVYLDNSATSQKPAQVINCLQKFYQEGCANIHRGIYKLSEHATHEYEMARKKVAKFLNAFCTEEIIFTSGATQSINMVAGMLARVAVAKKNKRYQNIVVSEAEHHSNLIPWQQLISNTHGGVSSPRLKYIAVKKDGQLDLEQLAKIVTPETQLVAIAHISNVLGVINPVADIIKIIKEVNPKCLVLIDAAQSVPHMPVDVQKLGCDFLVFSGHKMLGPTGTGVLWARKSILEKMEPCSTGGGMISKVGHYKALWAKVPQKFEPGTPNIAGAIGLGKAIDFLNNLGMSKICKYEDELTAYALENIQSISGVEIYGPKIVKACKCGDCKACLTCANMHGYNNVCKNRLGIISFNVKEVHAHDVAQVLATHNIAVRAGHHCAQPLHQKLGVQASVRASFYLYNTKEDVDRLVSGIKSVKNVFSL